VRLLLDTHIVLWWLTADQRLPESVCQLMEASPNLQISSASIWEMSIKQASGKLQAPDNIADLLLGMNFKELPIRFRHAQHVRTLPPIHQDPFDRILIAQALCDNFKIITKDPRMRQYPVDCLNF
jgi:PIN domain nuclease of toxin-antitoxin system